ncbi:hypothetical protein NADFUDRAFT_81889 [Nadsonia fulvescens var. elongata DSM 6958]|uniref:Protein SYM1 n=1 Tax=Nadsonia fulvescens var. elongata DSM 6958 TaxID=857566 RepID=A0A1E3PPQ4_9ASCO|nr:hypothetical protein NADFUDRAFT_81889 [Nadsonia fulvescens var. elongata DSM 6958]
MASLFRWYSKQLSQSPVLTNMITTGSLFGGGDLISQALFPVHEDGKSYTDGTEKLKIGNIDLARTSRAVIYGGVLFAPIITKWFTVISKVHVKSFSPIGNTLLRVAVDQMCFAPVGIAAYFTGMGLMEGKNFAQIKESLKANYLTTLGSNYLVWPAFQFVNFKFVPLSYRVVSANVISLFWNSFMSYTNSKGGHIGSGIDTFSGSDDLLVKRE